MNGWEFDLDLLVASNVGGVPFSVRNGWRKISEYACKTPRWSAVPGVLWELVAS